MGFLDRFKKETEIDVLKNQIKSLTDKIEDSMEDQVRNAVNYNTKDIEGDLGTSRSTNFAAIEEDVNKAQLQKLFITETWFYVVVNAIAQTIASLPIKLEQERKVLERVLGINGKEEEVNKLTFVDASGEPEYKLFTDPNSIQIPYEFYYILAVDLLTCGEAFIYPSDLDDENSEHMGLADGKNFSYSTEQEIKALVKDLRAGKTKGNQLERLQELLSQRTTKIKNLYRINPSIIDPVPSQDHKVIIGYAIQTSAGYFTFDTKEMIHIKMPNPTNAYRGLPPVLSVLKNLLIDRYTKEHMIRFYKQGARLGGIVKTKSKLTKEQITKLERTFESNYTGRHNFHRTLVLPQDMEYQTIEANPQETSLIEFLKANKEPIMAAYNVPPVKVGIMDGATFANALAQLKIYYTDTIMPVLTIIQQAINKHPSILPRVRKLKFSFDLSNIDALKEDDKVKAETGKAMIEAGLTVNEVRQKVWKVGPIKGGEKCKTVESFDKPAFNPMLLGGKSVDEKGIVQPDMAAITDIKPTNVTFEQRVSEITNQLINQNIPFNQALQTALAQAKQEGFSPDVPIDPNKSNTDVKPANTMEASVSGQLDPTALPDADKKKDPTWDVPKEIVIGNAVVDGDKPLNPKKPKKPHPFSKEHIVEHWKTTAGDSINPLIEKQLHYTQSMLKRLQKLFNRGFSKILKAKGMKYQIKAEDKKKIVDQKALDEFIRSESEMIDDVYNEALAVGFAKTLVDFPMDLPNEKAIEVLHEIVGRKIVSVTGTVRDSVANIVDKAYEEGVAVTEIGARINDKFKDMMLHDGHAMTIARTETLTAVSAGQNLKNEEFIKEYPDEGKTLLKAWISAQDEKVRDDHISFEDEGAVPFDHEYAQGLRYPRDIACDEAGLVINCRCSYITFLPEDEKDIMSNLEDEAPVNPENVETSNNEE